MNTNLHPTMQQALRPWMPPASVASAMLVVDANRPAVRSGLWSYEYNLAGHKLDCRLEYEAAYDGGTGPHSEPSWPESMTLFEAYQGQEDISFWLGEDTTEWIETAALEAYKADRSEV